MASRRRWRTVVVAGAMLTLASTVLLLGLALKARGLQDAANIAQLLSVVLALSALVAPLIAWWRQRGNPNLEGGPGPSLESLLNNDRSNRITETNARRGVDEVGETHRRPWMAPPFDRIVERPELAGQLLTSLITVRPAEVGPTIVLRGAGGFGKTRLATWACHRPEIVQRYHGGLLWVTVGQEVRGADLAERVNDLVFALCGQRPAISEPESAGAELGRLLNEREPVLLVIDDVWNELQLTPFRFGGRTSTRLVTTRIPDILPQAESYIRVDEMLDDQARELLRMGVNDLSEDTTERLVVLAGRWPLLLNLVNGVLRSRIERGQEVERAAEDIIGRLVAYGPAILDPARPTDRTKAVEASVGASLVLLDNDDQTRYHELAIFPEDIDIPLDVLTLLWPGIRVDLLCEQLVGLGLAADYRLDAPGPRLILHDVIRAYVRNRLNSEARAEVHKRLIIGAVGLLDINNRKQPTQWWTLPSRARYLWRFLPYHLMEAGFSDELIDLVCDMRWIEAKILHFGSVVLAESDLALVDNRLAAELLGILKRDASLLVPIDPPAALGATLASRLYGVIELQEILHKYRAALSVPLLEPVWPPPDLRYPAKPTSIGHTGAVTNCAFSPDGFWLATTSDDGTARIWSVSDGSLQASFSGHTGGVWGCAFSPDGVLLATTSEDRSVRLWQVADGSLRMTLTGHTGWVRRCTFSPDGTLLATASTDGSVRIWHLLSGAETLVLNHHARQPVGDGVHCAFSLDGRLIATAGYDGTVRLWDVISGASVATLKGYTDRWCDFSPDGTLLASTGNNGCVQLWRVADHTEYTVLAGHAGAVDDCAFSPDGAFLATTGNDGTVRLWEVAHSRECASLVGHSDSLNGCSFSPDNRLLATTSDDGTVRLWTMPDGNLHFIIPSHTSRVTSCAFSPDGEVLATTLSAAADDRTVQVCKADDATSVLQLVGPRGFNMCTFSSDGTFLAAAGYDGTTQLWQMPGGTSHMILRGHKGWVRHCSFSPDNALFASVGIDRAVRLWRMPDGAPLSVLTGHVGRVSNCTFSPDGRLLATASFDETVRLWDVPEGSQRAVLTGHADAVTSCAFSPDGALLATASDDTTVRLWTVSDGISRITLTGHTSWVESCAFSPDGTLLATTGRDGTVRLWNVATGRCHCALRLTGPLAWLAWHPDGVRICVVGGAGVYLLRYVS